MKLKPLVIYLVLITQSFISCEDILEETDITEKQVTVLAPLDGSTIADNQIRFNWQELEGADSYRIQVALPSFDNASQILMDSLVVRDSLDQIDTHFQLPLLNGNYQWRIKGLNSGFETPFALMDFIVNGDPNVDLAPPNTPILVAPSDGTVQNETDITFSWSREDVSGSTEKDSVYIFTDVGLQNLEAKGLGANKTYTKTLTSNGYYWFVKAFDAAGNESESSTVFQLTINNP